MPKRSREETDEQRWQRKKEKYEKLLTAKKRRRIIYSDEEGDAAAESNLEERLNVHDTGQNSLWETNGRPLNNQGVEFEQHPSNIEDDTVPETAIATQPVEGAAPSIPTIDPTLLEALGDCHTVSPDWGEEVLQDISNRWEPILMSGLKKENKEELMKKYLFPKNMPSSKPPTLNPELSAALTETCKSRDSRVCYKQGQLGHAIAALGKAITGILTSRMETHEVIRTLNDAGKLIADSHFLELDTRRSLIMPLLDKSYVTSLKDRKRDSFLFGENLGEFIKSSQGVKKTGQLITPPPAPAASSSGHLNWKGPLRQQQNYRASRGGAGAPRAAAAVRRAQPPPPPPPPPPRRPPPRSAVHRTAPPAPASRSRASRR